MNYDLLFEKCLPLNIDLNWLIYGIIIPEKLREDLIFHPVSSDDINDIETEKEQKAIQIVEMINNLTWPITTKRILMENYLYLVYREEIEKHTGEKPNN